MHRRRRNLLLMGKKFDSNAKAYFNAAGITYRTERNAANTLIKGLKSNNLWSLCTALYMISPTSLAAAAVNARTPGTFDITWVNTPSFSVNGVDFNGTTQYGRTGIVPSVDLSQFNFHLSYYSRENNANNAIEIGSISEINTDVKIYCLWGGSTYSDTPYAAGNGRISFIRATSAGFVIASRITNNSHIMVINGSEVSSNATVVSQTLSSTELYIGANNSNGTPVNYSNRECICVSVGQAMTATQASTFNTLIEAYQDTVISGGSGIQ